MVATALSGLDLAIVATAMPTVAAQLGGLDLYAWTFSAYLLSSTSAIPLYGLAADRFGRRSTFLLAAGLLAFGSAACGLAQSMPQLIAARLLQGAGGGGVYPLMLTIVGDQFETAPRARLLGLLAAIWGASALIGPAVGGFSAEQLTWRLAFLVQLPLLAVVMGLVARYVGGVPSNRAPRQRGGLVSRAVLVGAAAAFALGITLYGQPAFVPQLLQGVLGASPTAAGLALSSTSIGWPVASNLCGRLVMRWGYRGTGMLGAAIVCAGFISLRQLSAESPLALAAACNAICGFGFGVLSPTLLLVMQDAVGWSHRGVATSLNQFATSLGGTFGVALAGLQFSRALEAGAALADALLPAFGVLIAAATMALALTVLLPAGRPPADSPARSSGSRTSGAA